jgi:nucleoside-diphosphate-sugar epimerase
MDGLTRTVGAGQRSALNELPRTLGACRRRVDPSYEEPRPGNGRRSHADVSAAARELGFRPRVSVEQGLRLMLDWFGR